MFRASNVKADTGVDPRPPPPPYPRQPHPVGNTVSPPPYPQEPHPVGNTVSPPPYPQQPHPVGNTVSPSPYPQQPHHVGNTVSPPPYPQEPHPVGKTVRPPSPYPQQTHPVDNTGNLQQPLTVFTYPTGIQVVPAPELVDPPTSYLGFAIFAAICCCWPIGIVAIMKAVACKKAIARRERSEAEQLSSSAIKYSLWSVGIGSIMTIVFIVLGVLRVQYTTYY